MNRRNLAPSLALGALTLLATSGAMAQEGKWRHIDRADRVQVAVDTDSFTGPRSARTVRTAMSSTEAGDPIAYMLLNTVIDCDARTINGVSVQVYGHDGALRGERALPPEPAPLRAVDGTADVGDAACDGKGLDGRAFATAKDFSDWVMTQRPAG